MNDNTRYFHLGMLAALAVVAHHDQETVYREIVETTDVAELVAVAREDGQMQMSGLVRYGYGKRYPRPAKPDPALSEQLAVVIAVALRENDDLRKTPMEVAWPVIQATGLRRATWAALSSREQSKVISCALVLAREKD